MDLRQIENIIAIEQEQSISRAAEKLFLTQSALNQQLLKLEKELGLQLFDRNKHFLRPTSCRREQDQHELAAHCQDGNR